MPRFHTDLLLSKLCQHIQRLSVLYILHKIGTEQVTIALSMSSCKHPNLRGYTLR